MFDSLATLLLLATCCCIDKSDASSMDVDSRSDNSDIMEQLLSLPQKKQRNHLGRRDLLLDTARNLAGVYFVVWSAEGGGGDEYFGGGGCRDPEPTPFARCGGSGVLQILQFTGTNHDCEISPTNPSLMTCTSQREGKVVVACLGGELVDLGLTVSLQSAGVYCDGVYGATYGGSATHKVALQTRCTGGWIYNEDICSADQLILGGELIWCRAFGDCKANIVDFGCTTFVPNMSVTSVGQLQTDETCIHDLDPPLPPSTNTQPPTFLPTLPPIIISSPMSLPTRAPTSAPQSMPPTDATLFPTLSPSSLPPTRVPTSAPQSMPPTDAPVQQPLMTISDETIHVAVELWLVNQASALEKYGNISTWDTSTVTNMSSIFTSAESYNDFNDDISGWDTSSVTTMESMFAAAISFDHDLSGWNTSRVTNMYAMFEQAFKFNGDVDDWDTSSVKYMHHMFRYTKRFNRDISSWNTSSVTTMFNMFNYALAFNHNISSWDTSSVEDMRQMFLYAPAFAHQLCWDLSSVFPFGTGETFCCSQGSFMEGCVSDALNSASLACADSLPCPGSNHPTPGPTLFPTLSPSSLPPTRVPTSAPQSMPPTDAPVQPILAISDDTIHVAVELWLVNQASALEKYGNISTWDTSTVTNMNSLFKDASYFNDDISGWDTSSVTAMEDMFWKSTSFDCNLSGWDTSRVTSMYGMFDSADNFNGDIDDWDTSSVKRMTFMFFLNDRFNRDISSWNTSSVTTMFNMFNYALAFNHNISSWDTSSVEDMSFMFLCAPAFAHQLCWDLSSVFPFGTGETFCGSQGSFMEGCASDALNLASLTCANPLSCPGSSRTSLEPTLYPTLSPSALPSTKILTEAPNPMLPTDAPVQPPLMAVSDETIHAAVQLWVKNQSAALETYGNISTWDTSTVTNMNSLFKDASYFNDDISGWDTSSVNGNVTNMNSLFKDASYFNDDISGWDTSSVTAMEDMFWKSTSFDCNLSGWDTSRVTSMYGMFDSADNFNGDIDDWDTSSVKRMTFMFFLNDRFNRDISSWNTSSVRDMAYMFRSALAFNQNISNWDTS
eukprot:CAMPEP_0198303506 /NCGR_PEP_ID=MMETSP1449-20131203/56921_1 /TAXON_ID=420275 /ORGANISM="Attheya septentrionalis, Strain CCMP2084" /LENGTH=1061 /DNA_ID=CAMNT_0044006001 /DNA_START=344 /DNA_END=3525 /DNA_ORIENTATION=-